jgi:hypothetical protein
METDIGNPIEYNPSMEEQEKNEDNKIQEEQYYFHPSEMTYAPPPPPPPVRSTEGMDIFKSVDKSTWIIAFAVFLLGFFMGKTMQPVILRYS